MVKRIIFAAAVVLMFAAACVNPDYGDSPDQGDKTGLSVTGEPERPLASAGETKTPPAEAVIETVHPEKTAQALAETTAYPPPPATKWRPVISPYPPQPPEMEGALEAARGYLAEELGLKSGQIGLMYIEPVLWRDAGLGCPQPGKTYGQKTIPGFRVVFQVGRDKYEVHTDQNGKLIALCEGPAPGERLPIPRILLRRAASAQDIVRIAVEHLADTLDVPRDQIEVVRVEDAYWEDKTLGCPRPPGKYPDRAYPKPIPGYLILLAYNGKFYEYHSGGAWLIYCGPV